jgi:hypothetical protein
MAYGTVRFEAEWVTAQHVDGSGEWNPDMDEYACSYHDTRDAATQAAIAGGKASGVEWLAVSEQHEYQAGAWTETRHWSGDWQGLHTEVR